MLFRSKIKSDPEPDEVKQVEFNLWKRIQRKCIEGRRTGIGVTAEGDMLAEGLTEGLTEALGLILALGDTLGLILADGDTDGEIEADGDTEGLIEGDIDALPSAASLRLTAAHA